MSDALSRFKEGLDHPVTQLERDGTIKRFEFTFETTWKALKIILEKEGIICISPKECFKAAFRREFIKDESLFLQMLEDRNQSVHVYDEKQIQDIFDRLKNYKKPLENLLVILKKVSREQ